MVKSFLQYGFARDWPAKIYFAVAAGIGIWKVTVACQPSLAMLHDPLYLLSLAVAMLIAPVVAFFASLFFASTVLGPLYFWGAKLNGAPFHIGDQVRILAGPHRNRIVEIYDI